MRGKAVGRALALRRSAAAHTSEPLLLPVAGGSGALVRGRDCRRLVSLLDPSAVQPEKGAFRHWLERRQARRSALLLVPDRAVAMRFAGRWKLDLARIRLAPNLDEPPRELIERYLAQSRGGEKRPKPWHAS